jgi:hypothetical protein
MFRVCTEEALLDGFLRRDNLALEFEGSNSKLRVPSLKFLKHLSTNYFILKCTKFFERLQMTFRMPIWVTI